MPTASTPAGLLPHLGPRAGGRPSAPGTRRPAARQRPQPRPSASTTDTGRHRHSVDTADTGKARRRGRCCVCGQHSVDTAAVLGVTRGPFPPALAPYCARSALAPCARPADREPLDQLHLLQMDLRSASVTASTFHPSRWPVHPAAASAGSASTPPRPSPLKGVEPPPRLPPPPPPPLPSRHSARPAASRRSVRGPGAAGYWHTHTSPTMPSLAPAAADGCTSGLAAMAASSSACRQGKQPLGVTRRAPPAADGTEPPY